MKDVRPALARAARGGVLDPPALLQVGALVRAALRTRAALAPRADLPLLAARANALAPDPALAHDIERSFDSAGTILDTASPRLSELRRRVREVHAAIRERLDSILADAAMEEVLQGRYFSVRGDRYVVPVKVAHRARVPGRIHNASQSGQTLFIEPQVLQELGDALVIAEWMAREEEQRILAALSERAGAQTSGLEAALEALAHLDARLAAARLAEAMEAEPPELEGPLALRALRHPLLALKLGAQAVVSNNVTLGDAQCLIISGPNAGGNTVTVTAVGLCAVMAGAGLPIPTARGSRMPLFAGVRSVVGEQSDLDRGLSTFTAHLAGLQETARAAGPGVLAVIDEIAAGTDPREGAALGRAVLEERIEKGATVLATTHLEELKALGLVDSRFRSARMELDPVTLAPTFRLWPGAAGASSALVVARRLGFPEGVVARAERLLAEKGTALSQAVAALEAERARRAAEMARAVEEATRARRALEETERERAALAERERALLRKEREDLLREIAQARRAVREIVARLHAAAERQPRAQALRQAEEARAAPDRAAEEQARAVAVDDARAEVNPSPAPLEVKTRVRVLPLLGQEGEWWLSTAKRCWWRSARCAPGCARTRW